MRTATTILLIGALSFLGACASKTTITTPAGTTVSVNTVALDAAEALQVACEVAAPLFPVPAGALVGTLCPAVVTSAINYLEAQGTAAEVTAAVNAAESAATALQSSGTLSASDAAKIQAILAGVQGIATIVEANTTTGSLALPRGAMAFAGPATGRPKLTKAERKRAENLRSRATKQAAKKPH